MTTSSQNPKPVKKAPAKKAAAKKAASSAQTDATKKSPAKKAAPRVKVSPAVVEDTVELLKEPAVAQSAPVEKETLTWKRRFLKFFTGA